MILQIRMELQMFGAPIVGVELEHLSGDDLLIFDNMNFLSH